MYTLWIQLMENLISWVLKRINNRDKSLLLDAVKRTQQTHSAAKVTKKNSMCQTHTAHTNDAATHTNFGTFSTWNFERICFEKKSMSRMDYKSCTLHRDSRSFVI